MHDILNDTIASAPLWAIVVTGVATLLVHAWDEKSDKPVFWIALAGIGVSAVLTIWRAPVAGTAYSGMLKTGGAASAWTLLFLVATLLTLFIAWDSLGKAAAPRGEFTILVLFAVAGMIPFSAGNDLLAVFIGLEILSVSLYTLVGLTRRRFASNEAALKYFLLGAFAGGFFLYGIAFLYGAAQTTNIEDIARRFAQSNFPVLFLTGSALLLVGLAFKTGAVPFHMWVPDVYQGAPTAVTTFLITGGKAAAFGAFVTVFTMTLGHASARFAVVIGVLALCSMVFGNIAAIPQTDIKRMLAYSSIGHAGYMLIGVQTASVEGAGGVAFYLLSYILTSTGAFGVVAAMENEQGEGTRIEDFAGLGYTKPLLGALLSLFLFSLIGIPPFSGFFAKYYIFLTAIEHGDLWLVLIGVATSVVSLYFYLRVMVVMFFRQPGENQPVPEAGAWTMIAVVLSAAGVIALGLFPGTVLDLITSVF
ncbi:MAG: NADH-quinone oxidoreductase subunit N [Bacteroidota bacterium]|nr:NADH-quinone oxidoreductase subunit N [Bacteroidota bacterium]